MWWLGAEYSPGAEISTDVFSSAYAVLACAKETEVKHLYAESKWIHVALPSSPQTAEGKGLQGRSKEFCLTCVY